MTNAPFEIHIPTVRVPVPHPTKPDNGFEVRGVNMTDLAKLMADHAPNIALLYRDFMSNNFDLAEGETGDTFRSVINDMPALYTDLLTLVGPPCMTKEHIESLPMTVQLTALEKIGEATFSGEETLEKFLAVAAKMFGSVLETANRVQSAPVTLPSGT